MNEPLFQKTKKFVTDAYEKIGNAASVEHFVRTVDWLTELEPGADEAMKIAAFGHDIERAFRTPEDDERFKDSEKAFLDREMLDHHQSEGARIIGEFLEKESAPEDLIIKVKHMIIKHEDGGDDLQNLLKDADSISFFETNAPRFVEKFVPKLGKETVKQKFDWMFERITSDRAKEIAEPMYKKSLEMIGHL